MNNILFCFGKQQIYTKKYKANFEKNKVQFTSGVMSENHVERGCHGK